MRYLIVKRRGRSRHAEHVLTFEGSERELAEWMAQRWRDGEAEHGVGYEAWPSLKGSCAKPERVFRVKFGDLGAKVTGGRGLPLVGAAERLRRLCNAHGRVLRAEHRVEVAEELLEVAEDRLPGASKAKEVRRARKRLERRRKQLVEAERNRAEVWG